MRAREIIEIESTTKPMQEGRETAKRLMRLLPKRKRGHLFNTESGSCIYCGISCEDDCIENTHCEDATALGATDAPFWDGDDEELAESEVKRFRSVLRVNPDVEAADDDPNFFWILFRTPGRAEEFPAVMTAFLYPSEHKDEIVRLYSLTNFGQIGPGSFYEAPANYSARLVGTLIRRRFNGLVPARMEHIDEEGERA